LRSSCHDIFIAYETCIPREFYKVRFFLAVHLTFFFFTEESRCTLKLPVGAEFQCD
jgi:hypothetical protein